MVTLTSQILGTFSRLPAESVDLNPGHLLTETARLTLELALTFTTASQVLSASFLLLQHSQAFPSSLTAGPRYPEHRPALAGLLTISASSSVEAGPHWREGILLPGRSGGSRPSLITCATGLLGISDVPWASPGLLPSSTVPPSAALLENR